MPRFPLVGLLLAALLGLTGCPSPTIDDDDDSVGDDDDSMGDDDDSAGDDDDSAGDDDDDDTFDPNDADRDGWTPAEGDCDDDEPLVHPENPERCDGLDNDCDRFVDENWDDDYDGWVGDDWQCRDLPGARDCNDTDNTVFPGAPEVCNRVDDDCDGTIPIEERDPDGDGTSECLGDCAPNNANIGPSTPEVYDLIDNDCSGAADDGLIPAGSVLVSEWLPNPLATPDYLGEYIELENTWSDPVQLEGMQLSTGEGSFWIVPAFVLEPGARVVFAGSDDLAANGGVEASGAFRPDLALASAFGTLILQHGFVRMDQLEWDEPLAPAGVAIGRDPGDPALWCGQSSALSGGDLGTPGALNDACPVTDADGDGWPSSEDCDDADPAIHPAAVELCDGLDNDCDGAIDGPWDLDGDGWALDPACEALAQQDCDDEDPAVFPGAFERLNNIDDDCDTEVDEAAGSDLDGDGLLAELGDCDDDDPAVFFEAEELLDGLDNDCDGLIDEPLLVEGALLVSELRVAPQGSGEQWFELLNTTSEPLRLDGIEIRDAGLERFTIPPDTLLGAGERLVIGQEAGTAAAPDLLWPGFALFAQGDRLELWAGRVLLDRLLWQSTWDLPSQASLGLGDAWLDASLGDERGRWCISGAPLADGSSGTPGAAHGPCSLPLDADGDGFTIEAGDCNDLDDAVFPGNPKEDICDGRDNDCNGIVDDADDFDGDGYGACQEEPRWDCIEGESGVNQGEVEVFDGDDNDCNHRSDDTAGDDEDQDGYLGGWDDCHDADDRNHLGAVELPDGEDNDCDGLIDEGLLAPGDVFITELQITPIIPLDPRFAEWIEIYNASSRPIAVRSLVFEDQHGRRWRPIQTYLGSLAPGRYAIISGKELSDYSGLPEGSDGLLPPEIGLPDGSGSLTLWSGETELFRFEWTAGAPARRGGTSIGLDPAVGFEDLAAAQSAGSWCLQTEGPYIDNHFGTPGGANSACAP